MKKILIGVALGFILIFAGAYFFLISGAMPVATKGPPLPLEKWVTSQALHAAMRGETETQSPYPEDSETFLAGSKIYKQNCAVCHGTPAAKETAIAKGLFPKPPQFFKDDEGVTDDPSGEIFWFVKNGVRLTGMPGFTDSLSEKELWQVSLFLKNTDKLSQNVKDSLNGSSK